MKDLSQYILEALEVTPASGIGAFQWQTSGLHVVIDNIINKLLANGYKEIKGRKVNNYEYKVTHNGFCLTVGLKENGSNGDRHKVFIRQDASNKIDIVAKHIPTSGSPWYAEWVWDGASFKSKELGVNDLGQVGTMDDTAENAELIFKKLITKSSRWSK